MSKYEYLYTVKLRMADALRCSGPHKRYTDRVSEPGNLVKLDRAGDRSLQLLVFNEEFLVSASHQFAFITSLPFVHTAHRYYRLNGLVRSSDWSPGWRRRHLGQPRS